MIAETKPLPRQKTSLATWAAAALLLAVLGWSYYEPLSGLVRRWYNEPDYIHGFLVPVFAGYLLWIRRDMIQRITWKGSWWGLGLLAVAAAMRWASAYFYFALADPVSLVPCLAGVVLFACGWRALWWAWPAVVFLAFMVPLPGFVAGELSHPLQRIGTEASAYLVQTLGIPAVTRGNVIVLPTTELGVVEACNGLRMMMLFFAVCVGGALLMKRTLIEKLIIVVSAVPIAIMANVLRITVTAILYQIFPAKVAEAFFHDLAGWFMMPMAVLLLWAEMWVMEKALAARPDIDPAAETLAKARRAGA